MLLGTLLPITSANLLQLIVNGVITGSSYALVAVGFGIIVHITHRFHIAYAGIYALMAFMAAQIQTSYGIPFGLSLTLATLGGVLLAVLVERALYAPIVTRVAGRSSLFPVFVASLGIDTAIEACLNIIWKQPITLTFAITPVTIGRVHLTNLTLQTVLATWIAIIIVVLLLKYTRLGMRIRAVRVNAALSVDFGIRPERIYMAVFAIGTALGGIGAVYLAAESGPQSDMGENLVLFAITAAFIAGESGGPLIIAILALAMGLVQNLSLFLISSTWSTLAIFAILLAFVTFKAVRGVNWLRVLPNRTSGFLSAPTVSK